MDTILQFDSNLFLSLNQMHSPWWDSAMLLFTRKETWLFFYLMIMLVAFRNYERKAWLIIIVMILGVIASDQISTLIKFITQRPRPGHDPVIGELVHIVLRKGGLYGFVSSHASNTFFILAFTTPLFRNRLSFFTLLLWTLLISYTRIYNGNHYPLDIIGGWVLGLGLGILFYRFLIFMETRFFITRLPRFEKTPLKGGNAWLLFLTLAIISVTVLLIVYVFHKYNFITPPPIPQ
jgi:undecaprenyl-diphosphatase